MGPTSSCAMNNRVRINRDTYLFVGVWDDDDDDPL